MSAEARAHAAFLCHFGETPEGVAFAPGRVNLIGDHVDYCDGLVLPMPLQLGTAVAWRRREERAGIRALAADFADETDSFSPGEQPAPGHGWRTYLRGMAAILPPCLEGAGGLDLAIAGDLPRGAGLSSSASLCTALARALVAGGVAAPLPPVELARAAQRAEHDYAKVACGIMDQMASTCGQPGHAMLLDCRTLGWRDLALPAGWAVMIVPSGVTRGLVDGEYNLRRTQCQAAARALGAGSLRDVPPGDPALADLPEPEACRARHVVEEIARVEQAADCLLHADLVGFGACLGRSHQSLRDLFEVSHPQVDRLVATLQSAIGLQGGARMTGGGFGGAVVAVMAASETARVRGSVASHYGQQAADAALVLVPENPVVLHASTHMYRKSSQ